MLRAVISPEWSQTVSDEDVLVFNPEHGQTILSMVNVKNLGGLSLNLMKIRDERFASFVDGTYPIFDTTSQQNWRGISRLNLAFDRPAVIAMLGVYAENRMYARSTNPGGAKQLEEYFAATSPSFPHCMGYEKIMLPLAGVEIVQDAALIQAVTSPTAG